MLIWVRDGGQNTENCLLTVTQAWSAKAKHVFLVKNDICNKKVKKSKNLLQKCHFLLWIILPDKNIHFLCFTKCSNISLQSYCELQFRQFRNALKITIWPRIRQKVLLSYLFLYLVYIWKHVTMVSKYCCLWILCNLFCFSFIGYHTFASHLLKKCLLLKKMTKM